MRIAIIGAGISGLTAAYYLRQGHSITVYESAPRIGGHTATVDIEHRGREYAIDTGFIVYNDWTYPKFIELLDELGIVGPIGVEPEHGLLGAVEPPAGHVAVLGEPAPGSSRQHWIDRVPLGRAGSPEEVAATIVFLASDDAAYLSGQVLAVDAAMNTPAEVSASIDPNK